jgi:predicted RNase H-like nuclease (RuvC/YqgF family)
MKKLLLMAGLVALASACSDRKAGGDAFQQQRDSLQAVINAKDGELNDLMGTFYEVQEGISRINQAEGRVAVADGNIEAPGNKAIIRENMQYIEETMQRQRELIDQLKQKLQSSSVNVDKLQKTVASLEKQVQEQGVRIQELEAQLAEKNIVIEHQTEEISNLNSSVSELTTQNEQQAATLAAQEQDLNTGWFVFGTKTELTEQKILQKGEVLRSEDFATDYFTKVDIRQTQNIKFYSKSAKMLTTHPAGSYRLSKNDDGEYELHILNTKKFWSVSRFLVVLVK